MTVAGRPVARLARARPRQRVRGPGLQQVWTATAPEPLSADPGAFGGDLEDPFAEMRALLDTWVLIGADSPGDIEGAIGAASLALLHFGVLVAGGDEERARRAQRLGVVEATFDPLPIDAAVARGGRLAAVVSARGGRPRRRAIDLATAATANVHRVPLLTHAAREGAVIGDLVEVRAP